MTALVELSHFTDDATEAEGGAGLEFELRPTDLPLHPSSPGEDSWSGMSGNNWEYQTLPVASAGLNFFTFAPQNLKLFLQEKMLVLGSDQMSSVS